MVRIDNNGIIIINRGDVFDFPLFINVGNRLKPIRYKPHTGDKIYFGVMPANCPFEKALIRKAYDKTFVNKYGDIVVHLYSKDTEHLIPGIYYYEIKLEHTYKIKEKSPYIETIKPRKKFLIVE